MEPRQGRLIQINLCFSMIPSFFTLPFWRNFQNRQILVLVLSEREHRLRDAWAHMRLREFLPPEDSKRTTFVPITIAGRTVSGWPGKINPEVGVIILGRPSLFGEGAQVLLRECNPPL